MGGVWYGSGVALTLNYTERMKTMQDEVDEDDDLCENCRCTCDQDRNQNSLRSFYIGKVVPDQKGL